MTLIVQHPFVLFVFAVVLISAAAVLGLRLRTLSAGMEDDAHQDVDLIIGATLTLLALIIGFSFSMAISRYDQRKNYEEEEANAIGTEYARASLLANAADTVQLHSLLKQYLRQRIAFYETTDREKLVATGRETAELQDAMWKIVSDNARAQGNPVSVLIASGMNDVLNTQGYTLAAWLNCIPTAAWALMLLIAALGNALVAYGIHSKKVSVLRLTILPLILGLALFAIADIDIPRNGIILVQAQNLQILAQSLK